MVLGLLQQLLLLLLLLVLLLVVALAVVLLALLLLLLFSLLLVLAVLLLGQVVWQVLLPKMLVLVVPCCGKRNSMDQVNHGFEPDMIKLFCQKHMQDQEDSPPSNASSSIGLVLPFLQPSALQPAIPSPEKDQVAKAAEPPNAEATEAEAEPMGSAPDAMIADESQKAEPEIPREELTHDMSGVYNGLGLIRVCKG